MVSPLQIKIQQQKIRNTYCLDFGSKQSLQQGCCAKILKMYTPGLKVAIMQYTYRQDKRIDANNIENFLKNMFGP